MVSLAIINSSSVGINATFAVESAAEIMAASRVRSFTSLSILMPIHSKFLQTSSLSQGLFSAMPAVNTLRSTPPSSAI